MTEGSDLEAKVESVPTQPGQNAYSQPSSLTSSILNKLTNAVKKATMPLALGAALLAPQYAQNANAAAVMNLKLRGSAGYDFRVLQPTGQLIYVPIEFDNTAESNGTKHIEVSKVNFPTAVFNYLGAVKNLEDNFFAGTTLGTNKYQLNNTIKSISSPYPITRKRGRIAEYVFEIKQDAQPGTYQMQIENALAKDQSGNVQKTVSIPLHFVVATNAFEYLRSGKILWIVDQKDGNAHIHIPAFEVTPQSTRLGIRKTYDFKNWQHLATNKVFNAYTYHPLDLIDLDCKNEKAFYEIFPVKE